VGTTTKASRDALVKEFDGISLGDRRLDERARRIVEAISGSPSDSFPRQEATVAGREALYRFLSNPKVSLSKLLSGHVEATVGRMKGRPVVRVVHDSSSFEFKGERDGLGILLGNKMGFIGHVSLAIAGDESREPLGVLGVSTFVRKDALAHRGMTAYERFKASRAKPRSERESSRWERQAIESASHIPAGTRAIHVMDQEADDYLVFGELMAAGVDFVIRASPNRVTTDGLRAGELLASKRSQIFRTVTLSARPKKQTRHGARLARAEREATLELRWGVVSLGRGHNVEISLEELSINAVHVIEPTPPDGVQPVEWMLFTSEPVTSLEEATTIVDHYRSRWMIEEYFKALKTGCSFEKRQLTSLDSLTRALGLLVPVAWHLLLLRHQSRAAPTTPATSVFDSEQLLLLRTLMAKYRYVLPPKPTVRDAMLGIAALGGHIRSNGDPGWQVLGRGFTRFLEAEEIWRLARCDQS
jgi:hypothetical protein